MKLYNCENAIEFARPFLVLLEVGNIEHVRVKRGKMV
jgi:hypothetical protein